MVNATDRDLWQGPKQEVRESRTSGFCAQPQKFETIGYLIGYHRLQKWPAIALARYPGPCQRSRSVALAKRIAALGTRMGPHWWEASALTTAPSLLPIPQVECFLNMKGKQL